MKEVMRSVLLSPEFSDPANYFALFVAGRVRGARGEDVGWAGYSVNDAQAPLGNMGQNLFDPPDVNGWDQGATWFSTGSMLARMNYASALATNQRFNLATKAKPFAATPRNAARARRRVAALGAARQGGHQRTVHLSARHRSVDRQHGADSE